MKTAMLVLFCCSLLIPVCSLASSNIDRNTDRPGSDYRDFAQKKNDFNECQQACLTDPDCKAWTYVKPNCPPTNPDSKAHCWLKNAIPRAFENNCCISGIKSARASGQSAPQVGARISPAQPASHTGACPATITFNGRIVANAPGEVTYVFERSDESAMAPKTLNFAQAGSQDVSTTWNLGKDYSGWVRLVILYPKRIESPKTPFHVKCQ